MTIKHKFILRILFCFFITILCYGCVLDNKPYSDVSTDISESVKRKVFLEKYKVNSLKTFDSTKRISIESVWLEKSWGINIDSNGREVFYINRKSFNIIFKLASTSGLKEKDYLKNWMITNSEQSPGGLVGPSDNPRIFVILDDTLSISHKWKVYKLKESYTYNRETVKIAEFSLTKI